MFRPTDDHFNPFTQVNDFDKVVAECARCLRPGGVLIVIDGEPPILGEDRLPFTPADPRGTYPETKGWFARILHGACCPPVFVFCAEDRQPTHLTLCSRLQRHPCVSICAAAESLPTPPPR
jgi:SAM-dependent methyltransferase